jgi:predicted RNA-binding Zn-ribbon protein involved in translation (DUF1610 family)
MVKNKIGILSGIVNFVRSVFNYPQVKCPNCGKYVGIDDWSLRWAWDWWCPNCGEWFELECKHD